jgi:SMI1 / KNR4 family (SUKH-1)
MLQIGTGNWVKVLKEMTEPLGWRFWAGFTVATENELRTVERKVGRKLDPEFREFYRTIGYGRFHDKHGCFWGLFCSPEELVYDVSCPIYFITGSKSPGREWATDEQHTQLWLSRGKTNPNRKEFTEDVLTLNGVKLYDLLQFGNNGHCCYHQLYVGPDPAPLRYCLLTDSQEMEDRSSSFSEGLQKILEFYLMDWE